MQVLQWGWVSAHARVHAQACTPTAAEEQRCARLRKPVLEQNQNGILALLPASQRPNPSGLSLFICKAGKNGGETVARGGACVSARGPGVGFQ